MQDAVVKLERAVTPVKRAREHFVYYAFGWHFVLLHDHQITGVTPPSTQQLVVAMTILILVRYELGSIVLGLGERFRVDHSLDVGNAYPWRMGHVP